MNTSGKTGVESQTLSRNVHVLSTDEMAVPYNAGTCQKFENTRVNLETIPVRELALFGVPNFLQYFKQYDLLGTGTGVSELVWSKQGFLLLIHQ